MPVWREARAEHIARATRMVCGQAECSVGEAILLLRAHAELRSGDLEETAVAVLERRIRFGPRRTKVPYAS